MTLATLAQHLAVATTPLLIRGLLHLPDWRAQADTMGSRARLLQEFGREEVKLSVGTLLSHGPESTKLDHQKLSFMREAWGSVTGAVLRESVARQVLEVSRLQDTCPYPPWNFNYYSFIHSWYIHSTSMPTRRLRVNRDLRSGWATG